MQQWNTTFSMDIQQNFGTLLHWKWWLYTQLQRSVCEPCLVREKATWSLCACPICRSLCCRKGKSWTIRPQTMTPLVQLICVCIIWVYNSLHIYNYVKWCMCIDIIICKWGLYGDTAYINPAIFQGTIRQRTVGSSAHFKENKPLLRCSHWNAGKHKR